MPQWVPSVIYSRKAPPIASLGLPLGYQRRIAIADYGGFKARGVKSQLIDICCCL